MTQAKWKTAQSWEGNWWDTCQNTFNEEKKQLVYADRMGLKRVPDEKTPYRFDLQGKKILDIGGGPISLLLKCDNVKGTVIDPLKFPDWVIERYKTAGIDFKQMKGEDIDLTGFDEVWTYNCLQHTESPAKIIENAQKAGKLIRIFEWIENGISAGHLHNLTKYQLNQWLNGEGRVENMSKEGLNGQAFYGVFLTQVKKKMEQPEITSKDKKTYVVLGSKRGGTSFIAEALGTSGVEMDICGNGHNEDADFVRLNDAIFEEAGGDWNDLPSDKKITKAFKKFKDKAKALIKRKGKGKKMWGWKDPRQGATIKHFLPYLKDDTYLVCVFRKPKRTVASMKRVWNKDIKKARKVTDDYNRRIIDAIKTFVEL